jgi:hypothetical protein
LIKLSRYAQTVGAKRKISEGACCNPVTVKPLITFGLYIEFSTS